MKSRLPWLEGKSAVVTSSGELCGPSPGPIPSHSNPVPPHIRNQTIPVEKSRPRVYGGVTSNSSSTASDATSRGTRPPLLRARFSPRDTDDKPLSRPVRGLRPPGGYHHIDPGSPSNTSKIELVTKKLVLPIKRDNLPMMQEPVKELRSRPTAIPLTKPVLHTWSTPESWPIESSNSDMVSPMSTKHEKKRSFHEPELNAAIDRMEDLMQQAGELANEAVVHGRPQELSHIDDAAAAFHSASHASRGHKSTTVHQPLRFRVTNTSSESGFSCSSSSSNANIVRQAHTSQDRHTRSEDGLFAGFDVDPFFSRGRTKHREINVNEPRVGVSGARDFAHPQRSRSRSRSSSSHKHWIGRRPTRKFTVFPNAPIDTFQAQSYPREAQDPRPIRLESPQDALRQRKKTTQQTSLPPRPWVPPHHNMTYEPAEGEFRQPEPTRRYVNWDKELSKRPKQRNHHDFGLESCAYQQRVDPEQAAARVRHGSRIEHVHTKRDPISRRWGVFRKRFVATVACVNTALVGFIIGIYVRVLAAPSWLKT
jgi:hypothetical protein